MSVTPARRLSFHGVEFADDEAEDVSDYIAGQHLQNVTNPQIQPIEKAKRGRKTGTKLTPNTLESFRTKRSATLLAKKGAVSAAAAEQAALYAELASLNSVSLLESASKIKTKRQVTPKKRADINDALSASANIELLVAGGGAAAADDGRQPQQTRTPVPPSSTNASSALASRAALTSRRVGGGAAKKGGGKSGDGDL